MARDATFLRNLSLALSRNGFEAVAFSSAEEFLKESSSRKLACMVLDLSWPEMDGLNFGESFADGTHREPTFFLSGQMDRVTSVMALKTIAVHIVGTPKALPKLLSALQVGELTARNLGMDFRDDSPGLKSRDVSPARRLELLCQFLGQTLVRGFG